jgi:hypothetical protein
MARKHARIIQHPFTELLQGALLDSYQEEQRGGQLNITLNLRAVERTASELFEYSGKIYERVQGKYVPRCRSVSPEYPNLRTATFSQSFLWMTQRVE